MRFLIILMLFATGCALFEDDTSPPVFFDTGGDAGQDAADAATDGGIVDASSPGDSGNQDVGTDASDMEDAADMPPDPWRCPAQQLGTASPTSRIQLEALEGNAFVAGWREQNTLRFAEVGSEDGSREFSFGATTAQQDFYILAAGERTYYIATLADGLNECSQGDACSFHTVIPNTAQSISGDWNGGDYLPYVHFLDADQILTFAVVEPGNLANTLRTSAPSDASGILMELIGFPPSPGLDTPTHAVYVSSNQFYSYQRLTSGEIMEQPATECTVQLGDVSKVIPAETAGRVFADIVEPGGSRIVQVRCGDSTGDGQTGPLTSLQDWDIIEGNVVNHVFHVAVRGLGLHVFDGELQRIDIAPGDFLKVSAARRSDNGFGVLTVDAQGVVEFRSFGPEGQCD